MNIFKNLIDELKEENLLEETVVKTGRTEIQLIDSAEKIANQGEISDEETEESEIVNLSENQILQDFDLLPEKEPTENEPEIISPEPFENDLPDEIEIENRQETVRVNDDSGAVFYRKRANEEVAFLQMVEHAFAGLERDQMKIVPKPFDVLEVKKVLHKFLQVSKDSANTEQAQAEFQLLQETESWYSTLTHRDRRISINNLRRYCETARPPLSSPALVSLARFYRNSPYSEQARAKFDFIVTRLFSRDILNERREMIFDREELMEHLKELYADWSSIPLYSIDDDDAGILLLALKFEDFMIEAASAASFDELIKKDFFNRLRLFKKGTNENFFSPLIVAAAVESNIRIGNRYVELLDEEQSRKADFEDKYGFLHDQTISDATGKTFQLVELLNRKIEEPKLVEPLPKPLKKPAAPIKAVKKEIKIVEAKKDSKPSGEKNKIEIYKVEKNKNAENKSQLINNKWLVTAVLLTVVVSFWLFFWANSFNNKPAGETVAAKTVNLDNSSLKETIEAARIIGETFSATVLPSWNNLAEGKKEEILKKLIAVGNDKGFKAVELRNSENKLVGTASPGKVEIRNP